MFQVSRIKHTTLGPVRGTHRLSDAEPQMPQPVWRVSGAEVREIGTKAHLQIDDRDAHLPGGGQDFGGGADGLLNHGQINARPVKHAILGPKVMLHVDDEHRRLCGDQW